MTILHLEGESNDWWLHGIKTFGHDNISSYEEFSKSLVERFDRKYPEIPFKELAQLKQIGTLEAYMLEFQKILVIWFLIPLWLSWFYYTLRGW